MIVDLRSDTVTRPTAAMKQAMMDAPLGDDVLGDDPTVRRLEAEAARRAGKEAALFTPSGTMANQLAIRGWTQPGDEVLMEAGAHPFNYEAGGPAVIAGVQIRPIAADRGLLVPDAVWPFVRPPNDHFAPATLLCVENTANRGGGSVYAQATLDALCEGAHARGLKAHLDGARAFNAVVATGVPLDRLAAGFDSVSVCFSKGLGAPVGSILCGPADFVARARRHRKLLGGGMRQAGLLAAAALHALDHHVERLADDHRRARTLYDGLRASGYDVAEPETNMVYVTLDAAEAAAAHLDTEGVRCLAAGPRVIRLVTHLDVDDDGIAHAVERFAALRRAA